VLLQVGFNIPQLCGDLGQSKTELHSENLTTENGSSSARRARTTFGCLHFTNDASGILGDWSRDRRPAQRWAPWCPMAPATRPPSASIFPAYPGFEFAAGPSSKAFKPSRTIFQFCSECISSSSEALLSWRSLTVVPSPSPARS
jgi:hypothetical protein